MIVFIITYARYQTCRLPLLIIKVNFGVYIYLIYILYITLRIKVTTDSALPLVGELR